MSLLADLLDDASVLCAVEAKSRKRVLQSIAELMADERVNADSLFEALMERERLGSTGLGDGVAIPHCRISCEQMKVALVTLAEPIDYEALDGQPVDLLFVLVVPVNETHAHLDALAELSRVFAQADKRQQLRTCRDPGTLAAAMRGFLHEGDALQQSHQA